MSQINTRVTASSLGAILTLTGNSGGAVPPTAGNINVLGSGGINVAGNPGTSTLTITTTNVQTYTLVNTTPYVVLPTDQFLGVDTTALAITIQLPNAPTTGRIYAIKDIIGNAPANNVTVTTVGGIVLIDGATTFVMNTSYESIQVLFTGTAYVVF